MRRGGSAGHTVYNGKYSDAPGAAGAPDTHVRESSGARGERGAMMRRVEGRDAPALMVVAGLTKRYGDLAVLSDVGFALERGEILGLIGPNGSGKTTLLECLAGLLLADAGTVCWDTVPLPRDLRKTLLFYLPDGITPYAEHPVKAVLSFFARAYRIAPGH